MKIITRLEKLSQPVVAIVGFALIVVVGVIDFLTGYEIAFSLFYLLPISLITWFAGRQMGMVAALASGITWYLADVASGHLVTPLCITGTPG